MSKSAVTINYETRPCKFVERRMLLASLSRILGAIRNGKDYQYIGFGGCSFTDFKLFHKELQIDNMYSIEDVGYSDSKLEFNKPFQCIKVLRGKSNLILPTIDFSIPSIVWLDYDGVLKNYMFEDIETILHTIPSGSIFIISCNRELKKGNYEEMEDYLKDDQDGKNPMSEKELRRVFGDLVPFSIPQDSCTPEKSHETIKLMLDRKIMNVIENRNISKNEHVTFRLLYNIRYQEHRGAPMYTYGGIVCDEIKNVDAIYFDDFDFVTQDSSAPAYQIDVPVLTHREAIALNQIIFNEEKENEFVNAGIVTRIELNKYKKIYKYCPSFHDVRI